MRAVRRAGTAPELEVRKLARAAGLSYRLNTKGLPGSPDLANQRRRWAIFVHGCFWHRHQKCGRATTPKSNFEFWQEKFARNIDRDARHVQSLIALNYDVLILWECELAQPRKVLKRLQKLKGRTHRD
jgi:DNA mismatch endonuclease (patch repair protein)